MFPSAQSMESADLQNSYLADRPFLTKFGNMTLHRGKKVQFVGKCLQLYPRFRTTNSRI